MHTLLAPFSLEQLPVLLRGQPELINTWIGQWNLRRVLFHLLVIVVGAALFGLAVGWWRAPQQALFTAVKLPLIILLTTVGNALINGMLAPLFGLNLGFRQSLLAILLSFSIAATILGAFSPMMLFLVWNAPLLAGGPVRSDTYSLILLVQVAIIAFAGIVANLRLAQLLQRLSRSAAAARNVLLAWLGVNLFLGSQLSWMLRPFVGSPGLPLEFLRADALHGNFYEAVFRSLEHLLLN